MVQEAKSLPGVGSRLAEKIWEIVERGELRKLDELTSLEETKALELFTNVWGAGNAIHNYRVVRKNGPLDAIV